jgi:hypothetical protein
LTSDREIFLAKLPMAFAGCNQISRDIEVVRLMSA